MSTGTCAPLDAFVPRDVHTMGHAHATDACTPRDVHAMGWHVTRHACNLAHVHRDMHALVRALDHTCLGVRF